MVRELPDVIRGCTHVDLTEAFFSLRNAMAYVRGTLGTVDEEGAYHADTDLKECNVTWHGAEFMALIGAIDGEAIIIAAGAKNWGFGPQAAAPPIDEDVAGDGLIPGPS